MTCICDICECEITCSRNLSKHKNTEKCQTIKKLLDKKMKKINETIININTLKDKIKVLEEDNKQLKSINNDTNKINEILNTKIKNMENTMDKLKQELQDKNNEIKIKNDEIKANNKTREEYRKIVEKAALKSTNTNNILNCMSSEPLRFSEVRELAGKCINSKTIRYEEDIFHEHIINKIFKDKEGKNKVVCTDINRNHFSYKDEQSGQLISDPLLEKIRTQLRKGVNIAEVRNNLLNQLLEEYNNNDCIGPDPYVIFAEINTKLNLDMPFVKHSAKKMYNKTVPVKELIFNGNHNNTHSNNDYSIPSIHDMEHSEYISLYENEPLLSGF